MIVVDIPEVLREALAAHMIFKAFGIPAEDIYLVPRAIDPTDGIEKIAVQAKQNGKDFTVSVGPLRGMTLVELPARWTETVETFSSLSGEEAARIVDATQIRSRAVEIFAAMLAKGFEGRSDQGDLR